MASWATSPFRTIFVGGAEALYSTTNKDQLCANGSRVVLEYDGSTWEFLSTALGGEELPEAIFATTGCPNGLPTPMDTKQGKAHVLDPLRAVYGFNPQRFYAAGDQSLILSISTSGISRIRIKDDGISFRAMWGSNENDLWLVGGLPMGTGSSMTFAPRIYHYDGSSWSNVPAPPGYNGNLLSIWGTDASNVFAVGVGGVIHFDGNTWSTQPVPSVVTALASISGQDATHVYAVGSNNIIKFDGKSWTLVPNKLTTANLLSIAFLGDSSFLVGGMQSFLAVGAPEQLTSLPALVGANGLHTIAPYGEGGALVAGGNLFDPNRTDEQSAMVAVGAQIALTFAPRASVTGGAFATAAPPAPVGGAAATGW